MHFDPQLLHHQHQLRVSRPSDFIAERAKVADGNPAALAVCPTTKARHEGVIYLRATIRHGTRFGKGCTFGVRWTFVCVLVLAGESNETRYVGENFAYAKAQTSIRAMRLS
jgi:hypothetical protein